MKNDCFAINGDKCKILLDTAFVEYKKAGNCGSDDCPFYKPKGQERTYTRGLSAEEKAEIIERLRNEI